MTSIPRSSRRARKGGTFKRKPPAAGKGRKKGTPNRQTYELKKIILDSLHELGGVDYLTWAAERYPKAYLALLGKILPLQVEHGVPADTARLLREQLAAMQRVTAPGGGPTT